MFGVVRILFAVFIVEHLPFVEVVIVVDEVNLHACGLYACHLDDERMVRIVDDDVQSRETDDLMQLVTAFVNVSPTGHKGTDFKSVFLYALGNLATGDGHLRGFYVRNNLLGDEQDFLHVYLCRCFVSFF
mgnify:CR=1 FL=1